MPRGESWQRGCSEISLDITGSIAFWSWAKRGVIFPFGEVLVAILFLKFPIDCCRLLADGARMALQSWGALRASSEVLIFVS